MSPREKQFILLISLACVAIVIFSLVLCYTTHFFYITFIVGLCGIVWYFHNRESLSARLGLNPRRGVTLPFVLRRWLTGRGVSGVPVPTPGRLRSRANKADVRNSGGYFNQRLSETGIYRTDKLERESFLFSPRDILMGSYIGKAESDPAEGGRPNAGRSFGANPNPRVQLRERLSRPNYAVHTPNRRLSFTGEPQCGAGRFAIAPQRHYPLQQPGTSAVGVLPPSQWDGFRKKNVLSPRNATAAHSPVTVKIARPDHGTPRPPVPPRHVGSPAPLAPPGLGAPADPCSRESVLKVLRERRKREVEEDVDGRFTSEQKSKRRRNDSGGSSHCAFDPLLPNGVPSQLVPKPGALKRGSSSAADDGVLKRSRTSSIGSASPAPPPSGTPGSVRNPIRSSYSSSQGCKQWKRASAHSSPLSSPGSSRSQTPERASKKPREDVVQAAASLSSVSPAKATSDAAPAASKLVVAPKLPLSATSDVTASGKRKRKIQLVSSLRGDQIILPPPPELGYTVTVKDLDQEKEATLNKIHKVLVEPEPPERPGPSPAATSAPSQPALVLESSPTLSSLLAAPLPTSVAASAPVIDPDPSPASSQALPPASNPLLDALKMKRPPVSAWMTSGGPGGPKRKPPDTNAAPLAPVSLSPGPPSGPVQPLSSAAPSAFTQVLGLATRAPSGNPSTDAANPFGLGSQLAAPAASSASSGPNPLLASGFKPIFVATSTSTSTSTTPSASASEQSKPAVPTFKPLFGGAAASAGFGQPPPSFTTATTSAPVASSASVASIFGSLASSVTAAPTLFSLSSVTCAPASSSSSSSSSSSAPAPAAAKSLFGSWGAPPATSAPPAPAPATGGAFLFGSTSSSAASAPPAPASSTSASGAFSGFGSVTSAPPGPQSQAVFAFGQSTTASSFGGFGLATTTTTTTTALHAPQAPFTFGKPSFDSSAAPPAYPAAAAAAGKQFTFGSGGSGATPTSAPAPAATLSPFTFGTAATTAGSTFGTPSKPTFGAGSSGFGFGSATTTSSAVPGFGAVTRTPSAAPAVSFAFGSAGPQQTPAASGGFNFAAATGGMQPGQFGTPNTSSPAPQMAGFSFGAASVDQPAFGTSTPTFGQSAAAGPIPFGSPGTPVQGFNSVLASPFAGGPPTPSFSIGAGSKPSGARQRLQARRQHTRKK